MIIKADRSFSKTALVECYDRRYAQPGSIREQDAFYLWTLKKLAPAPGSNLLDVACGEGHLVRFARQRGIQAFGADFSPRAIMLARRLVGSGVVAIADGESLPYPDASFDYLANLGSLEHFLDPAQGILEIRRVLRPGGRAAVLLPNSFYLADIVWHVWRTGYGVSHHQPVERFAAFREWWDFLEAGHLKVQSAFKYNFRFPATGTDWIAYVRRPRRLLYLMSAPFMPFNLSYGFLFICTR
jgi:SAM-dependent methyltransferase